MPKGNHGDQPSCVWSIHNPGEEPMGPGSVYGWGATGDPLGWGRTVPEIKRLCRAVNAGRKKLTVLVGSEFDPLPKVIAAEIARNLCPVNPKRRWVPCHVIHGETGAIRKFCSISEAATHLKVGRWSVLGTLHRLPCVEICDIRPNRA